MQKQKIEYVKTTSIVPNTANPRFITEENFAKLVKSISEFPQMLSLRPIIVDENMVALGGNMRLKACKDLKLKEVPIIRIEGLTEEQKKEFIIKDNASFGEWDWEELHNEWDTGNFEDWAVNVEATAEMFTPNYDPEKGDNEVTQKEVDKVAEKLEGVSASIQNNMTVACPHCYEEFEIKKD